LSYRPPTLFQRVPIYHRTTRFVREHEHAYPRPFHQIWRCDHCNAHYSRPVTRDQGISHVKSAHSILEPVIGRDVVHDKRVYSPRRHPFRLGLNPAFEFRCKRCPELPIYKLWEMEALTLHLRTHHDIWDPIEGDDWSMVDIIAVAAGNNDSAL